MIIKSLTKYLLIISLLAGSMVFTSCGTMRSHHRSSSAVQYLYPNQNNHIEKPAIPRLALPLKVGIAFVPERRRRYHTLTERDKMELMKEVSDNFKKFGFVKSIELIPSAYLRPKGSFVNLDQIRTMYDIDVIALSLPNEFSSHNIKGVSDSVRPADIFSVLRNACSASP